MSPAFYNVLHLVGILMLFMGYGALLGRALSGGTDVKVRKLGAITSGIGLLLMIVAGFGLIAKVYGNAFQGWMIAKIVIWVALGGFIALINRKPALAGLLWWLILGLGAVAAILVYFRPF